MINYYKPIREGNFQNQNYIKYESIGDRNRNPSVKEQLNEIKHYFRNIISDLQMSGRKWKVELTIASNFISSKDVNKEYVIHSKSIKTEFIS